MLRFLLKLKPQDLKVAVRLMAESRAGLCAVKKLTDAPSDLPEVEKQLARLEKAGLLKVNGEVGELICVMTKPMAEFTLHIQSFTEQLDFLMPAEDPAKSEAKAEKHSKRADMNAVMAHYAKARGLVDGDLESWVRQEYPKNARSLVRLLAEAGTVERACMVIDTIKKTMETDGMDWSLNGVVMTRMHSVLRKAEKQKGGWDW